MEKGRRYLVAIFVFIMIAITIVTVILIRAIGGLIGLLLYSGSAHRENFAFLSEQFSPIFDDVNSRSDNEFFYIDADYLSGHIPTYYLNFAGEGDFVNSCIKFQNDFAADIKSGDYTAFRLEDYYTIKISSSNGYVIFWYDRGYVKTQTNIYGDYSAFENVDGIDYLNVLSRYFTEEQVENISALQDDFSFELYISDDRPWC